MYGEYSIYCLWVCVSSCDNSLKIVHSTTLKETLFWSINLPLLILRPIFLEYLSLRNFLCSFSIPLSSQEAEAH